MFFNKKHQLLKDVEEFLRLPKLVIFKIITKSITDD